MNWLKKLFARTPRLPSGSYKITEPLPFPPHPNEPQEAARITGESLNIYLSRLDREAELTGNRRLAQQAQRIRSRLGVAR